MLSPILKTILITSPTLLLVNNQGKSSDNNTWTGLTGRCVFPIASLTALNNPVYRKPGRRIRAWFQASPIEQCTFSVVRIGHKAAAGDPYDFAATPTQMFFGGVQSGTAAKTVPIGGSAMAEADFVWDTTSGLVISIFFNGGASADGTISYTVGPVGGQNAYFNVSGDDTATVNATGYTVVGTQVAVNRIEMVY